MQRKIKTVVLTFMIMNERGIYFLSGLMAVVLTTLSFKSLNETVEFVRGFHIDQDDVLYYSAPFKINKLFVDEVSQFKEVDTLSVRIPYRGKTYVGFKYELAFKESSGKLNSINPFGYMGKYQFGKSTLRLIGVWNYKKFLRSEKLQDKALKALISRNKWVLRREIRKYTGKVINNVLITESGIVAAAHLGGPGAVKRYLRSNGTNVFRDGFGTSIQSYLKRFSGYDLSHIKPNKKSKVTTAS